MIGPTGLRSGANVAPRASRSARAAWAGGVAFPACGVSVLVLVDVSTPASSSRPAQGARSGSAGGLRASVPLAPAARAARAQAHDREVGEARLESRQVPPR